MIYGIWADDAEQFHPLQWVNVYDISSLGAVFYCCCQVKDLNLDEMVGGDYGLEPTDEEGNVMTVDEARRRLAA